MGHVWERCEECEEDFPEEVVHDGVCPACSPAQCIKCGRECDENSLEADRCPSCFDDMVEAQEEAEREAWEEEREIDRQIEWEEARLRGE